jgi:hypothetical protein
VVETRDGEEQRRAPRCTTALIHVIIEATLHPSGGDVGGRDRARVEEVCATNTTAGRELHRAIRATAELRIAHIFEELRHHRIVLAVLTQLASAVRGLCEQHLASANAPTSDAKATSRSRDVYKSKQRVDVRRDPLRRRGRSRLHLLK